MTDPEYTPTPLTRAERLAIARTPGAFAEQIRGAMVYLARYKKDGGATGPDLTLANAVLDDSHGHVARFADVAVFDDRFNGLTDASGFASVSDSDAQAVVDAIWGLFTRE